MIFPDQSKCCDEPMKCIIAVLLVPNMAVSQFATNFGSRLSSPLSILSVVSLIRGGGMNNYGTSGSGCNPEI